MLKFAVIPLMAALLATTTAWAAPSPDVEAILDEGGADTLERLVDFGVDGGVESSVAVLETVARGRPQLLPETVRGLMSALEPDVFDESASRAVDALADDAQTQQLLLAELEQARWLAARHPSERRRSCAGAFCDPGQRIAPGNQVNNPPGSDPGGPPPGEEGLLDGILNLVQDPLASPS